MNNRSINQDDVTTYVEGFEDIKQCWKNILYTVPGTYPLLPTFGCDLWKYIDNPTTDSFGKVRNVIIAALEKFEPRAKINKVTRVINGSQIFIDIMAITSTGEDITARVDLIPAPEPPIISESQKLIYIGFVTNLNPTEFDVKNMVERPEERANQSFTYNIDAERCCIARRTILGAISSIKDQNGFEIISGFEKTTMDLTIAGQVINYTILTLIRPTTQTNFTVTYIF